MPIWKLVNTLSRGHVMFCCFCGTRDLISQFPGFRINLTIVVFSEMILILNPSNMK